MVTEGEIEGGIHIQRLDRATDPQPWTYAVSFAPYHGPAGSLRQRKCVGLDELRAALEEIGILPDYLDQALEDTRRTGTAQLPRVRLTRERIAELDL